MKILIADDQKLLRDCLKHAIEQYNEFQVAACVENGKEAVEMCLKNPPDLVLMDIMMPVCDGLEAVKRIKETNSGIKVMMLTSSQNGNDVDEAMGSGADGYILKSIGPEELILAIRSVASGFDIIHRDAYKASADNSNLSSSKKAERELRVNDFTVLLTERDIKIINFIAQGKDVKEIANELYLAEGRVRNIITEIISKLFLRDKAQLVAFAYKNNLVTE